MNTLALSSLEIRNFRAFQHLKIEQLGRVNLIVGKNNVGKSSLLEAVRVYARRGDPALLLDLLEARNELNRPVWWESGSDAFASILNFRHLFRGRQDIRESGGPIIIGPHMQPDQILQINVLWFSEQNDEAGQPKLQLLQPDELRAVQNYTPVLSVDLGSKHVASYFLEREIIDRNSSRPRLPLPSLQETKSIRSVFVSSSGLDTKQLGQLWDSVALTEWEQDVVDAIRVIEPDVDRINLVGDPEGGRPRMPVVKVRGLDEVMPLRSMGEGMNRLFEMALALVNARDGILLVDEFESGLHYTVQADAWRLVFEVAHRLNVQVFATSHSWDCIEAFEQAAEEDQYEGAMLIRLERRKNDVITTSFGERELAIATREQIEVR
jgi:hypothetical protein